MMPDKSGIAAVEVQVAQDNELLSESVCANDIGRAGGD